jgi:hypothetical protein
MLRFAVALFTILLCLSACATVASGPRLSQANVRQIADAEVRRARKIDLRQYDINEPVYIPKGDYWSVVYHLKTNKRVAFAVRVSDKRERASIDQSDAGVFEGALGQNPNH